jgi:hypothetical protein
VLDMRVPEAAWMISARCLMRLAGKMCGSLKRTSRAVL